MITKPATLTQENFTFPVNLAVWAMRMIPGFVSPDDTAHDRRVAEEKTPFLVPFFSRPIGEYFKGKEVLDFGCALGGTALAWEAMYGTKKISGFDASPYFIEGIIKAILLMHVIGQTIKHEWTHLQ